MGCSGYGDTHGALYEKLPVIVVEDWSEVTPALRPVGGCRVPNFVKFTKMQRKRIHTILGVFGSSHSGLGKSHWGQIHTQMARNVHCASF